MNYTLDDKGNYHFCQIFDQLDITSERSNNHSEVIPSNTVKRSKVKKHKLSRLRLARTNISSKDHKSLQESLQESANLDFVITDKIESRLGLARTKSSSKDQSPYKSGNLYS